MARVRDRVQQFEDVSTLDGVRVDLMDAWFLRASGTQPLVRVIAEARTDDRTEAAFERARAIADAASEAL
jgi:phosphoglucosamine mutase